MFRPTALFMTALPAIALSISCDTGKLAVNSTSKILVKAQPSLKMESDYEHAGRAIPGALKTVEGFHVAYPDNTRLTGILAEGYCQYGTGFVEDEWEIAHHLEKDYDKAEYVAGRATKMFIRCTNYGLELLGGDWAEKFYGPLDDLKPLARGAGSGQRIPLMWAAIGLGSSINMNKDNVAMIDMVATDNTGFFDVTSGDLKSYESVTSTARLILDMAFDAPESEGGGNMTLRVYKPYFDANP